MTGTMSKPLLQLDLCHNLETGTAALEVDCQLHGIAQTTDQQQPSGEVQHVEKHNSVQLWFHIYITLNIALLCGKHVLKIFA